MSPEQLQDDWNRAQALEAAGALDGARALYAALLASSPRQVMVQLRLSGLEQAAGRYRASRQHALDAATITAESRRWEALPYVTLRLLAFDERARVQRLVLDADWTHPQVLAQSPSLSQHLSLCGYDEEALRLVDAASSRTRPNHLLEYSRANSLRNLGRLEEATAAYERCIALAPGFPYAHWSLAYHAPAATGPSRVPHIREALRAIRPQDLAARAHLHFALFKELDAVGEAEAAWTEWQSGAQLMRTMQPHDAAAEAAGLAATANAARHRSADATGSDARVPIFIVGMPRTGTTVLERILGGHPDVADAGELNDFQHAASLACDRFLSLPFRADDVATLASADVRAIGRTYLERTARHYGPRACLIDKNPQNFFAAGLIAEALPQARILCLIREPADACFSNLKELFAPGSYGYSYGLEEVAEHYARFRGLAERWRDAFPGQFLEVGYEELVADPARVSKVVMEFCGLPPAPECVDITRNVSRASTASSSQVRQPIHARNVGAWRRYQRQLQPMLERLRQHGFGVDAGP
jgi:tetratricopeptide (TPR) repeat protein